MDIWAWIGVVGGTIALGGFVFVLWCYRDIRRNMRLTRERLAEAAEIREETRRMREERDAR